ncbi:MAG: 5-formyltetrahydrofolate cyclo-ligase [Candidatus Cyclonatronum sp.]|uniref:5-formyltetrahydrofolate cyclo-ligase n=1 Tax=Cyclonatronum sp. TaxID=3024185 RepID=UPI0025C0843F|nr:5-formyltetrahydrofolate cyclo-ligase [Cyclonatronum sp.]MCH8487603.1 5-formyltetrahydrofolate cyclo-ligase [Cyclonatronum sp.]
MMPLNDITAAKKTLRARALQTRMALSTDDWAEACARIQDCFLDLFETADFPRIHLYSAMLLRNEIDTETLAIRLLRAGKEIAVPVMSFESRTLTHFLVDEGTRWATNRWGVSEPLNGIPVNPDTFGLIVVPMVAADVHCNRLGYGKGYYDNFLKNTTALKVGLCMECCIFEQIPSEPHDVRLNHVITENRFLSATV